MKAIGFFQLILSYLKMHRGTMFLLALFAAIFAVVFSLYNLPEEAVGYSVLLCGFTGGIFVIWDFIKYYNRHKLLQKLSSSILIGLDGLPDPINIFEEDYQSLLRTLHSDKVSLVSKADNAHRDMIDYYTLWVHQIKTPISAMGLLLQEKQFPENSALSMELFKIEQYVEMVLGYLRLDSDSSDLVLKRYSLDSIVKQAVRKYSKLFIGKKISLNFSDLNCTVLTDEKWLTFVIEQLLSNAIKYTAKGEVSIYMEPCSKILVIEDTGMGIQGEDLPRVFEKGFTGYNGRTDKKSTGIGLYLCKRILKKLSHTITVESEVGKGTKVKLNLDTVSNLTKV